MPSLDYPFLLRLLEFVRWTEDHWKLRRTHSRNQNLSASIGVSNFSNIK